MTLSGFGFRFGALGLLIGVLQTVMGSAGAPSDDPVAAILQLGVSDRQAAVETLAARGTPIVQGDKVTFLAEAHGAGVPVVQGGFNWFGRYPQAAGLAGGKMARIEGTSWYYLDAEIEADARIEYILADAEAPDQGRLDPNNVNVVNTFGSDRSVLTMPGFDRSKWVTDAHRPIRGKLRSYQFPANASTPSRQVQVYLPPGYEGLGALPVAYFHDGSMYAGTVPVPGMIEAMQDQGEIRPIIAVFVDPVDRSTEYRGEQRFLDFFNNDLIRYIDGHYPTQSDAQGRAIIGGSRGGMGAMRVALHGTTPNFAWCGMIQPAFTPATQFLNTLMEQPQKPVSFSMVGGLYDARFIGDFYRVADTLQVRGYELDYWVASVGHSHNAWQHDIPRMLRRFFPPPP